MTNISIPNIKLGAERLEINSIIFSKAHRLSWGDLNGHHSLNNLLATLSRQKQVLEAMGVSTDRHRTLDSNVIESKEGILAGSWGAFLFGGHVASGLELWTLGVDAVFTAIVVIYILGCIFRKCCLPKFRAAIAAVNLEEGQE